MAYTQSDINNIVNGVVNRFTGQKIAMPNGRYLGECSAPITWYLVSMGAPTPGMYNDRADGWGVSFPDSLKLWFTREPYQAGRIYPKGTILMWNSPHIAIVLSHDGSNNVEVFQQNADPDGAPCKSCTRVINNQWHTCNFALLPVIQEEPSGPPYTISSIPDRNLRINKDTLMYNLGLRDFSAIVANPVGEPKQGYSFVAKAILHHQDGYDYFLPDSDNPVGFNAADCDDYDPTPPPPAPYIPPAAPVAAPKAETYDLVTTVRYYATYDDALHDTDAKGTKAKGTYYVRNKKGSLYELADTNMSNDTVWVNTTDNVVVKPLPPKMTEVIKAAAKDIPVNTPEPGAPADAWPDWMAHLSRFNPDGSPEIYHSVNTMPMKIIDFYGKGQPETLPAYVRSIRVVGTIEVDGILYGLPQVSYNRKRLFLVPMRVLRLNKIEAFKRAVNDLKLRDKLSEAAYRISRAIEGFKTKD